MNRSALLTCTPFARRQRIFYAIVYGLLLFFAVAVVHDLIPGLCASMDGRGDKCPFCELVYAFALAVAVFVHLLRSQAARLRPLARRAPPPQPCRYPAYALRAPPAAHSPIPEAAPVLE